MANADAPFGLRPVMHIGGAPYNGAARPYYVDATYATALYIGDPVVIVGDSNDSEIFGFPPGSLSQVELATLADGNQCSGVIIGVHPATRSSLTYSAASTEGVVYVADDPDLIFEVQADAAVAADNVGLDAILVSTATASAAYGVSALELDIGTVAADGSLMFRILGFSPRVKNAELATTSPNPILLVKCNAHTMHPGQLSVGVA